MPPLAGCSLLYDPDRLPAAADAMVPPPDIFPCQMEVTDLAPVTIVEGMGDGGSRPAVLVISGKNLIAQNPSIMITPAAGSTRPLRITTDNAKIEIGAHGEQLSLPITLPVDPELMANEMIDLDVMVEQDCPDGRVSGMIVGKLKLRGLAELTSAAAPLVGGVREYSQINVEMGTLVFATPTPTSPIILRSTSSVKIANAISLNAGRGSDVKPGGPAGGNGGTGGNGLGGVGTPGVGPSPGLSSGAPGGFSSSDPGLNTLNNPNRSSGGAGGDGAVVGGRGGDGGGGGGSMEITAGGDLQVEAISARGAAGQGGSGGAAGGGGSGGVILLRAGGALIAGDLDVRSFGTGSRGLARYDAGGTVMMSQGELGTDHLQGPMFVALPFAFREAKPAFTVVGKPLSGFKYFFSKQGGGVSSVSSALFDASGMARVTLSDPLEPGLNRLCLVTESGTPTSETSNCAYIAYLP